MPLDEETTIRTATEDLAEALESYILELIEKNGSVQKHKETRMEVAADNPAFTDTKAKDDHPLLLIGELQIKGNYEPDFVCDFAPVDWCKQYNVH